MLKPLSNKHVQIPIPGARSIGSSDNIRGGNWASCPLRPTPGPDTIMYVTYLPKTERL